jgi:hypothetical protein
VRVGNLLELPAQRRDVGGAGDANLHVGFEEGFDVHASAGQGAGTAVECLTAEFRKEFFIPLPIIRLPIPVDYSRVDA